MFVYKLGAGRFDELLAAEVEENMRTFIKQIEITMSKVHNSIYLCFFELRNNY